MANSLANPTIIALLDRLFAAAENDEAVIARLIEHERSVTEPITSRERTALMETAYLPVEPESGRLLYSLVRATRPATVVEFGTSFGISTIYLAAAVRDNGGGRVVSTELSAAKAQQARSNLDEAGLGDLVDILEGDALDTLAAVPGPVGFVLLDGWKDLYLPVLRLLEPSMPSGALVFADDTGRFREQLADYLAHVRDPANGYVGVPFPVGDGAELSCRA
ncbi:MAG: class I SAM-dependent methyltransferase [Actinomycetota bacterium]